MSNLFILGLVLVLKIASAIKTGSHGPVDCAMGSSSCESCQAAYPFCYWCDGTCQRYYGREIAKIKCKGEVMYRSCNSKLKEQSRIEDMLKLLAATKKERSEERQLGSFAGTSSKVTKSKKAKLLRLLKLLKLLAYLEKDKKARKSSQRNVLSEIDSNSSGRNGHLKIEENPEMLKNFLFSKAPLRHKSPSTSDLDSLLNLVEGKKVTEPPNWNFGEGKHKQETLKTQEVQQNAHKKQATPSRTKNQKQLSPVTKPITTKEPSTRQVKHTIQHVAKFVNMTSHASKTTTIRPGKYCELFEQEDECNSDRDCSWCNILDECVGRNKEDFRYCSGDKRNIVIDDMSQDSNDICTGLKECKSCTNQGKCFWCEKTKSCHIYPFFGYIPHNCPANMWYYKECDVQLAIFIILFPLLMILISMVIFYFCLRFCYYRKRTLKVQLFEKPELFERRKGKKVYFVGGDEDDDDDESRSEQIRKKYNLPHEKEPLISP